MCSKFGDSLDQLMSFLSESNRPDVRKIAAENLVGLTAAENGLIVINEKNDYIKRLAELTHDKDPAILKPILQSLVNLTVNEELSTKLLSDVCNAEKLMDNLLARATEEKTGVESREIQDAACMTLANLTRFTNCCQIIWDYLQSDESSISLKSLVDAICRDVSSVNHLAMFLCNLSHLDECRSKLMNKESNSMRRLLPLVNYTRSDVRRKGVVGVIRNCCFDTERHDWLLGDEIGLLTALAYPLAGPEEYAEDEMNELPIELQYLGDGKQREQDAEIRKMLIEAINQLCAKPEGRKFIREQRIYLILRELHKSETVEEVLTACENLVDILIGNEPQPGMENLNEVVIPEDVLDRFSKDLNEKNVL